MITAAFDADFSAFASEVKKAEGDLQSFEAQTAQTGSALTDLSGASTKTAGPVNTLSGAFRQFDGVLGAMGIHIGPFVKALEELGLASGKSAAQIGLLGTAGLVAGAALAGWKLGRVVAEFFGLDNAIATNVAKWLGWGDTVKETSLATADAIALANTRSTTAVTTFTEAMRVNQKWVDDHKKAANDAADALKAWTKANEEVRIAGQDWRAVLETISGATVAAAKAALDHGVSQNTVATAYKLTAPQIAAVVSALAAEKEALKESEAEHARITAALKQHWDGVLAKRDEVFGKDAIEQAQQWIEAVHALGGTLDAFTNEQLEALRVAMANALDAMARSGTLTDHLSSEFAALALAVQAAQAAHVPLIATVDTFTQSEYDAAVAADAATQALQRQKDETKALGDQMTQTAGDRFIGAGFPTSASLDIAARRPGSMLGFGSPAVASTLTSVANQPWTSLPGQPIRVEPGAFVINYPIMNDPSAMDNLGRLVGDAMMARVTRTGQQV